MLGKDLLGLYDTSAEDILSILDTAAGMKKTADAEPEKIAAFAGADGNDALLREQHAHPLFV